MAYKFEPWKYKSFFDDFYSSSETPITVNGQQVVYGQHTGEDNYLFL